MSTASGVAPPSPRVVSTALGGIEYVETGSGPELLLLHGAMGGYDQSLLLGRAAVGSSAFRHIAVSRPGYLSTPLEGREDPAVQADLYAALLDELRVDRAAVIAVSGGGQSALQFALRHADRCWGLVLVSACSAPLTVKLPFAYHLMKLTARVPFLVSGMRNRALLEPDKAAARSIPDAEMRTKTLQHPEAGKLLQELQLSTLDRMTARLAGTQNDIDQSRREFAYPFEQIRTPVLIVHGTDDDAVPVAHADALASRLPEAEFLRIEGGRHVALFTHLDLVRARVRSFLKRAEMNLRAS